MTAGMRGFRRSSGGSLRDSFLIPPRVPRDRHLHDGLTLPEELALRNVEATREGVCS